MDYDVIISFLAPFLWSGLVYLIWQAFRAKAELGEPLAAPSQEERPLAPPRLTIPGTRADPRPWLNASLLKGHGVSPQHVKDLAWYELEPHTQVPAPLAECLAVSYREGLARGPRVRDLIVCGKGNPGDKVVFALVHAGGPVSNTHIVAMLA